MMTRMLCLVAAMALMAVSSNANAQGTRESQQTGSPAVGSNNTNRGTGTGSQSDPMGGAMRGTGVPTYGTSPGMGSDSRAR
jgi:hypothetical protein